VVPIAAPALRLSAHVYVEGERCLSTGALEEVAVPTEHENATIRMPKLLSDCLQCAAAGTRALRRTADRQLAAARAKLRAATTTEAVVAYSRSRQRLVEGMTLGKAAGELHAVEQLRLVPRQDRIRLGLAGAVVHRAEAPKVVDELVDDLSVTLGV
jgi:hypothetical protein